MTLGRRVYLATAVVLASLMRCEATPVRIRRLEALIGVSRRTVQRCPSNCLAGSCQVEPVGSAEVTPIVAAH